MIPNSPNHCYVEIRIAHPAFGQLIITSIQRHVDDCDEFVSKKKILLYGSHIPILKTIRLDYPPEYGWVRFYVLLLPWDWVNNEVGTVLSNLSDARDYIEEFAAKYDEELDVKYGPMWTRLETTIREASTS